MAEIAYRFSGLLLIAGAALLGAGIVSISLYPVMDRPMSPGASVLMLLAAMLLLVSLPAVYARQAEAAGWLGLAGHALLQAGIVLLVALAATPLLYPAFQAAPGQNIVLFALGSALTLGLLLTGIATVRAEVFPRWAGILLLAAMAVFFFDFFVTEFLPPMAGQVGSAVFGLVLAVALAWLGIALLMSSPGPTFQN